MIKIALMTPENSYSHVKNALKGVDAEISYIFYDNLSNLKDIYINEAHNYDVVITSGPIGYEIIHSNAEVTTPIYYLEITKFQLMQCLFRILANNPNIDFSRVYIDFVSVDDKEYWLENTFFKGKEPIFKPLDYSDVNLYTNFKNNYDELVKNKSIDLILTRISNMVGYIKTLDVEHIFLFPSTNTIRETVEFIIRDVKAGKADEKKLVIAKLITNDDINKLKKQLGNFLKHYVTQVVDNYMEIVMLYKDYESLDIDEFNKKCTIPFNIGWGAGLNINEARFFADTSLKKSVDTKGMVVYFADSAGIREIIGSGEDSKQHLEIYDRLAGINIIGDDALKIVDLFKTNSELTIDRFATYLCTTERTAGRILMKLLNNNMANYRLEKIVRGRPKKFYSLVL